MSADRLLDSVADFAAAERMQRRPEPPWALHVVSNTESYCVGVIVDDVMVVQVEGDSLTDTIRDALGDFRTWSENLDLLQRSLSAVRGTGPGNVNGVRR